MHQASAHTTIMIVLTTETIIYLCAKPRCIQLSWICRQLQSWYNYAPTSEHTTLMVARPKSNHDICMHQASVHNTIMVLPPKGIMLYLCAKPRCIKLSRLCLQRKHARYMRQSSLHTYITILLPREHHDICCTKPPCKQKHISWFCYRRGPYPKAPTATKGSVLRWWGGRPTKGADAAADSRGSLSQRIRLRGSVLWLMHAVALANESD